MVPLLPLLLAVTVGQSGAQRPPPNYSPDALPETSFSCRGRQPGGYYADVEAGCQMFHVCGSGQGPSFRFLCPNDTVFDQQNLICANWFEVVCELDSVLHARNFEIFKTHSNKETAFNVLHEDDLPELDDYEYDTGFSAGQSSFPAAPRFSSQRATTTARPVNRFDQFVAASTARPVIVTAPNAARWRGSTVTGTITEPPRLPPRENALDRGVDKGSSADQSVVERERPSFSVTESEERSQQEFELVTGRPRQDQGSFGSDAIQSFGSAARTFGSQSIRQTSDRVPPTSAPAESQTFEITSGRLNSLSSFEGGQKAVERPQSTLSSQRNSSRTTLTAAITVGNVDDIQSPAVNSAPTAAALVSNVAANRQDQTSTLFRDSLAEENAETPNPSRTSSFARGQSRFASRTQSRFTTTQSSVWRGLNDIDDNEFSSDRPSKDSQRGFGRLAPTSRPPGSVGFTFSSPVESRPLEPTTTELALSLSPVVRSFFGPSVLPEAAARSVQTFGVSSGEVRQNAVVTSGSRSETPEEDDVAVTTFRPRTTTTPSPPSIATTTVSDVVATETSTDDGIEIITESTIPDTSPQNLETTIPTVRRRGSRRRGGFAGRSSSNSNLARPRATAAAFSRSNSSPTERPAVPRNKLVTAAPSRSRSSTNRRGRGGRRFGSGRATVKPVVRRRQKVIRGDIDRQEVQQNSVGVDSTEMELGPKKEEVVSRPTTETSLVEEDQATASSISRPTGVLSQRVREPQRKVEEPAVVTTTQATATTTEAASTTPIIIRKRIRIRGRPSRRPNRRPSRRQIADTNTARPIPSPASSPAPSPASSPLPSPPISSAALETSTLPAPALLSPEPSPSPVLLPTNKEVAPGGVRLLRQPKLPLSSALPAVGRSRRLQQSVAAREARSGATRLVLPSSRGRYGGRPAARAQTEAPQRRQTAPLLSDYDYAYYDDDSDVLFRKLAEANELLLDGLTRVRRQN